MPDLSFDTGDDVPFRLYFGGPDQVPRRLRDLLETRIEEVPAGGEILLATYYFRDEGLARALLRAHRRGVDVRVTLEGRPRARKANLAVQEMLTREPGFGERLRQPVHRLPESLKAPPGRLHEKLYCFSHPEPHVLVGTFNPSGNDPEDPAVLAEIGDQDRGHNTLVEIRDAGLVAGLRDHARRLHRVRHGPWERLAPGNNRVLAAGRTRVYFFPRLRRGVIADLLSSLEPGSTLRLAVSHLNDRRMTRRLARLPERGVATEVLAHDTRRRVSQSVEERLGDGVLFRRYRHPLGLPMHNKFLLLESPRGTRVVFGSMNLSNRSLHANHELLLVSEDPCLVQSFRQRWDAMIKETEEFARQEGHEPGSSRT